jgi:hypothetical protein
VGVGLPENRTDLLLRIKSSLGAEAFATLGTTRFGNLRTWESVGTFTPQERKLFNSLVGDAPLGVRDEVMLKRSGKILLAGRGPWFLAAEFADEDSARERWRKEFLQFLASQFFLPVRSLDQVDLAETSRVLALTWGNRKRTSELLDISRGKLYSLLDRLGMLKR